VKLPGTCNHYAFTSDGARLITAGFSELWEWDVLHDSAPAARVAGPAAITVRSADGERQAAYTPDPLERTRANADGKPPEISVRDRAGKEILVFREHTAGPISSMQFSPDDRLIMSRTSMGEATVWEIDTGKVRWRHDSQDLRGALPFVRSGSKPLQTSPDGHHLALLTTDGIKVVHFDGLKDLFTAERATQAYFSPDSRRLVSVRMPGTAKESSTVPEMKLWDLETGQVIRSNPVGPASVAFSPDHRFFLTATSAGRSNIPVVDVWDAATGEKVATMKGGVYGAVGISLTPAFSPDGSRVVLPSGTEAVNSTIALTMFDVATGKELARMDGPSIAALVAFSPDGKRIAAAGRVRLANQTQVQLWDAASGRELLNVQTHGYSTLSSYTLKFSPDGYRLTLASPFSSTDVTWDATPRTVK
jgi:WD40 repeat protein